MLRDIRSTCDGIIAAYHLLEPRFTAKHANGEARINQSTSSRVKYRSGFLASQALTLRHDPDSTSVPSAVFSHFTLSACNSCAAIRQGFVASVLNGFAPDCNWRARRAATRI